MTRWCAAVVAAMAVGSAWAAAPPTPKVYHVEMRLMQGDPKGTVGDGTVEVLSQPTMRTVEGERATCFIGQTVVARGNQFDVGNRLRLTATSGAHGKIRLRVGVDMTDGDGRSVGYGTFDRKTLPGVTLRLMLRDAAVKETWLEVRVGEMATAGR